MLTVRELVRDLDIRLLAGEDGLDAPVRFPSALFRPTELDMRPRGRAPHLGEHTGDVLAGRLGYSRAQISDLRAKGVIR